MSAVGKENFAACRTDFNLVSRLSSEVSVSGIQGVSHDHLPGGSGRVVAAPLRSRFGKYFGPTLMSCGGSHSAYVNVVRRVIFGPVVLVAMAHIRPTLLWCNGSHSAPL
jgi:hypothetical protein